MKDKDYIIKFRRPSSIYIRKSENILCHWEKEDHKYIAKVKKPNGRYRYFYSEEEYKRYLENQKVGEQKEPENLLDKIGSFLENFVAKPISEVTKSFTDTISNGMNFVKKQASKALSDLDYSTRKYRNKIKNAIKTVLFGPQSIRTSSARDWTKYVEKVTLPNGKTRYFYDVKSYVRYMNRQRYQKHEPEFMKKVPDQDYSDVKPYLNDLYAEGSREELDNINPNWLESYKNGDKKYTNNCQLCTVAYELVNRGYDVEAGFMDHSDPERSKLSYGDAMEHAFENPVRISYEEKSKERVTLFDRPKLEEFIKNNTPRNSRGNLQVKWITGGGHSMFYEVDMDGNVQIRDAQVGLIYDTPEEIAELASDITATGVYITRLDNLDLKEGVLDFVEY